MGRGDKEEPTPTGCKKKLMDLKECVQDSPSFRIQLKEREKEIVDLEARLEKVVTTCDRMVSSGIGYTDASRAFSVSVKDLASHFQENEVIAGTLTRFYDIIKELQSYYSILFDQAQRSVQTSLRSFLSGELKKVKETKKVFHKVSDDLNSCSVRNANVPRNKLQECDESSVALANAQNMYSHHAIDYGYQINAISCVKGHEILSNLLSYMRAQFTFFHQGYDLLHEFDPFMRQVSTQVDLFQKEAVESISLMDSRHSLVASHHMEDGSPDTPLLPMGNPTLAIENSGYLFKKPRGNSIFKTWSKRWFILKDNKLVYQSESKDDDCSVVAEDMRMCTVKYADDLDRRFCFEIVTPWRSCMVQANSDALRKKWVTYIEASIARALRISASNKKMEDDDDFQRRSMMVDKGEPIHVLNGSPKGPRKVNSSYALGFSFMNAPGNDKCADCDGENPNWASINLGIMLCIECSGIHRSLGVHISKVRSVTLDDWDPDLQKIMCQLGNARVNAIYEFEIPTHVKKPTSESTRAARETFIRLKYAQHAFVHPHPNFERTDIPLPPPTIPELLAPSRSPLNRRRSRESPKSPTRRSYSPSFLRSPRLQKSVFTQSLKTTSSSRPGSASSTAGGGTPDYLTPSDSVEDLHQTGEDRSLALLAENFKKLEKSGKLKSWGSQKLSDKIRNTARRSSQRLSSFARNKFSEARVLLKAKEKSAGIREAYSDIEDDDMATTSTPLLYSMSASTNNLSSSYSTPPPKPPRTFATKRISSSSLSDDENELFKDSDDFSDILSAIKEMGVLCKSTSPSLEKLDSENGIPNGRIPENGLNLKKSESSPQLSHEELPNTNDPAANSKGNSPNLTPLNSIAEDQDSKQDLSEQSSEYLGVSDTSVNLPLTLIEGPTDVPDGERLVNSVPLRRKNMPLVSVSFDSALTTSVLTNSEGDIPASIQASETNLHMDNSNRFSILSTTSADFFSAGSSEASDSNLPSISVSPEVPPTTPKVYHLRPPSACSIEDECFSTPPSTPTFPGSSRSTLDREEKPTNQFEDVDHVTETLNLDLTNDAESKSTAVRNQVTADNATGIAASQSTLKSSPTKRKRSVTVSDYVSPKSTRVLLTHSKDDNFSTEYKQNISDDNGDISPVSLFSQQDMFEILGNEDPASVICIPEEIEEEPLEEVDCESVDCEGVGEGVGVSEEGVACEGVSGVEVVVIPDTVTPDDFLLSAVAASNLPGILCALAHGGKINSSSSTDKAPILVAIEAGNPVLIEYLFQNGAKLNCTDRQGRGSLHYAVLTDQSTLVVTLLKRGVKPELKDSEGKEAITYALERENGDIVTLLRMVTFREKAERGSDNRQSQYLEELQSEFFKDIEVASLVDLERSRKSTSDSSSVASRDS